MVATSAVTADEFGAVDGEFALVDEPPLGEYSIELAVEGQRHGSPSAWKNIVNRSTASAVTLPANAFAISGDNIPITVAADYFLGQPVGGANARLEIYRQPLYRYWDGWAQPVFPYPLAIRRSPC